MRVQIVSFHCVLKNKLGQFISSSTNQDVVANPSEAEMHALPGFVEALKHLKAGDRKQITVLAEHAYGFYQPDLQITVPRSKLSGGKTLKLNDEVTGQLTQDGKYRSFRVVEESVGKVLLDGNHPLAGQDLVFDIEVTDSYFEKEPKMPDLAPIAYKNKTGTFH